MFNIYHQPWGSDQESLLGHDGSGHDGSGQAGTVFLMTGTGRGSGSGIGKMYFFLDLRRRARAASFLIFMIFLREASFPDGVKVTRMIITAAMIRQIVIERILIG